MKKTYLLILLLLVQNIIYSQVISQSILEKPGGFQSLLIFPEEKYIIDSSGLKEINFINYFGQNDPASPVLPYKYLYVALPPGSGIKSLTFDNKKTEVIKNVIPVGNPSTVAVSDSLIKYRSNSIASVYSKFDSYPVEEYTIVGYYWLDNIYTAIIKYNTHTYKFAAKQLLNTRQAEINVSFTKDWSTKKNPLNSTDNYIGIYINPKDVKRAYDANHKYQANADDLSWIDFNNDYVKLGIPKDGIYRITSGQLIRYGIEPSSINPRKLKIYIHGKQLPVFVAGEDDGSFDSPDYIEFYAEKNYGDKDYRSIVNPGEDYKNYLNRYTDTAYAWLSWEGTNGERVTNKEKFDQSIKDTVNNYNCKIHLEEDERLWYHSASTPRTQLPDWQDNKVWTWRVVGSSGSQQIKFSADFPVSGSNVKITARVISNGADVGSNAHKLGLSLNSTLPNDTITFDYLKTVNFSGSYPETQLKVGDNTVRIFGLPSAGSFSQVLLDWVDINYLREIRADSDSLNFVLPDNISNGQKIIKIANVNSEYNDIILYRVSPDTQKITGYQLVNNTLYFTDNINGSDAYVLTKTSKTLEPEFYYKKKFVSLNSQENSAEYILITASQFSEPASEYLNWITSNNNIKGKLVFIEDICDIFSYGEKNPEAVKEFLINAYNNWSGFKPKYLFIIGEANYDYKNKLPTAPTPRTGNIVPTYGMPVSDTWFTVWDDSGIPQMEVGRITAETQEEVYRYLDKVKLYSQREYDGWNKNFLFFSGGDIGNKSELTSLFNTNQFILDQYVAKPPIGGKGEHFYKTENSNFGNFDHDYIKNTINEGGLFISYLGHSGTQTWDNGITKVSDIQNSYSNRFSLISDFGCSTGKFAEPDVDSFSEQFTQRDKNGIAINYLGNSSLGFTSTATEFPKLFYNHLLLDSNLTVGDVHLKAKLDLYQKFGLTDITKVFIYCNVLFGDPLIRLKLPLKPDLSIEQNNVKVLNSFLDENADSILLELIINNTGLVPDSLVRLSVLDIYNNQEIYNSTQDLLPVYYADTLRINIPVEKRTGQHKIQLTVDPGNIIEEIHEDNNTVELLVNVFSSSIRTMQKNDFYTGKSSLLKILNPQLKLSGSLEKFAFEFADNYAFTSPLSSEQNFEDVATYITLPALQTNKRYWWRGKPAGLHEWSGTYSFVYKQADYDWLIDENFSSSDIELNNAVYDSLSNSWKLDNRTNEFIIRSAGWLDGAFASIQLNADEYLSNTFFWGIAGARLDTLTLKPYDIKYFIGPPSQPAADSLIAYLNSFSEGETLILTISVDASQSVIGYTPPSDVREAIKNFGSVLIDSVRYREAWCMIGKKGAAPGTAVEDYKKVYGGIAEVKRSKEVVNQRGSIVFPLAQNSSGWGTINIFFEKPSGSKIGLTPLAQNHNNTTDTLNTIEVNNQTVDISFIDARKYPGVKFMIDLYANDIYESPDIKSLNAVYKGLSELAVNYQVVSISKDSVNIGENIELEFDVYNVGETKADSFYVTVNLVNENNTTQTNVFKELVTTIDSLSKKSFNISYNTVNLGGNYKYNIQIDTDDKILELYEDNNFYSIPFYVKPDTTKPTLTLTFDGQDIFDGEYISPNPSIKVELTDLSLVPFTDTSSVKLFLDNEPVYYSNNNKITYSVSSNNPKYTVEFKPELEDGEHSISVFAKDASGNYAEQNGLSKSFVVSNQVKLLDLYNYPNPFSSDTYFTFKLTQIPDEVRIKVYTIAGRLVKEIRKTSAELKFDFNKIYWDGRDEDGDLLGNGVYIYRAVIDFAGASEDITQKLAIVR